jgi:hypothetical protein
MSHRVSLRVAGSVFSGILRGAQNVEITRAYLCVLESLGPNLSEKKGPGGERPSPNDRVS